MYVCVKTGATHSVYWIIFFWSQKLLQKTIFSQNLTFFIHEIGLVRASIFEGICNCKKFTSGLPQISNDILKTMFILKLDYKKIWL